MKTAFAITFLFCFVAAGSNRLDGIKNYLVYYGQDWSKKQIEKALEFDLVIIHPGRDNNNINAELVQRLKSGKDGKRGTADDILVLAYISVGEDENIERGPRKLDKHHLGPINRAQNGRYELSKNGFRNWYLDQRMLKRSINGDKVWGQDGLPKSVPGRDKLPDENGKWNSYFVNVSDQGWQKLLKDKMFIYLMTYGCDGLFLDTIDSASPWGHYGFMQQEMVDLLVQIRAWYKDTILVMNRGLFLFEGFGETLKSHVDAVMFESFISEWNWYSKIGIPHRWYYQNQYLLKNHLRPLNLGKDGMFIFFLNYFDPSQPEGRFFLHELARATRGYKGAHYVSTPDLQSIKPPTRLPLPKPLVSTHLSPGGFKSTQTEKPQLSLSIIKKGQTTAKRPFTLPNKEFFASGNVDTSELEPGEYQIIANHISKDGALQKRSLTAIKVSDVGRPKKVEGVVAMVGDKMLTLSWKPLPLVENYLLRWGSNRFNLDKSTFVKKANERTFKSLKNGVSYYFQVAGLTGQTEGVFSESTFATPTDTKAPMPPSIKSASAQKSLNGNCVMVKWAKSPSPDISAYLLYLDPINLSKGLPIKLSKTKTSKCVKVPALGRYRLFMASVDQHNNESNLSKQLIVEMNDSLIGQEGF